MSTEISFIDFIKRILKQIKIIFTLSIIGILTGVLFFIYIPDKNIVSTSFAINHIENKQSMFFHNNTNLKKLTVAAIKSGKFKKMYLKEISKTFPQINQKKLIYSIENQFNIFQDSNNELVIIYNSPFSEKNSIEILKKFYKTFDLLNKNLKLFKTKSPFFIINAPFILYKSSLKLFIHIIIFGIIGFLIGILICTTRIKYHYDLKKRKIKSSI